MRTVALVALAFLAGCIAPGAPESAPEAGASAASALATGASMTGLDVVAQIEAPGGYALRVHEDRAYVATFTTEEGISIFDVSDPRAPVHLGGIVGTLARSVDVLDYGARTAVALSTGTELEVWEVTDPTQPVRLVSLPFGSHNVQVHPTAHVIYNARNLWDGVEGGIEIVDASDPDGIFLDHVWAFPPLAEDGSPVTARGCHDLTIFPETGRAYCAAYDETLILDISEPLAPTILRVIDHPLITSHHTAFPILDHDVLLVSDEWLDNLVWGCVGSGLPAGSLWFFDLTTPEPEVLGEIQAPASPILPDDPRLLLPFQGAMCTSHNGMEVGEGTGLIAFGWFHAGLYLIDASDPRAPAVLDRHDVGGAVGDARWYEGHVFAADDEVGLTVLAPR